MSWQLGHHGRFAMTRDRFVGMQTATMDVFLRSRPDKALFVILKYHDKSHHFYPPLATIEKLPFSK